MKTRTIVQLKLMEIYTNLGAKSFSIPYLSTDSYLRVCKCLFTITIFTLLCNSASAQLGVKFVKSDTILDNVPRPEATAEQKNIALDVDVSFRIHGFTLPLSSNKYEFAHNWNNNPKKFLGVGGIIVDKQGKPYSLNKNGDLVNHKGEIVDFNGIVMDSSYTIRKFFYWIESYPSYVAWLSIIITCIYGLGIIIFKKVDSKHQAQIAKSSKVERGIHQDIKL